jgi:hypothetical protein
MTRERIVRMVAGTLVVASLALGHWVSPWWFLLTALVGLNLLQSSFTGFCLLEIILKKSGVKSDADKVRNERAGT